MFARLRLPATGARYEFIRVGVRRVRELAGPSFGPPVQCAFFVRQRRDSNPRDPALQAGPLDLARARCRDVRPSTATARRRLLGRIVVGAPGFEPGKGESPPNLQSGAIVRSSHAPPDRNSRPAPAAPVCGACSGCGDTWDRNGTLRIMGAALSPSGLCRRVWARKARVCDVPPPILRRRGRGGYSPVMR